MYFWILLCNLNASFITYRQFDNFLITLFFGLFLFSDIKTKKVIKGSKVNFISALKCWSTIVTQGTVPKKLLYFSSEEFDEASEHASAQAEAVWGGGNKGEWDFSTSKIQFFGDCHFQRKSKFLEMVWSRSCHFSQTTIF